MWAFATKHLNYQRVNLKIQLTCAFFFAIYSFLSKYHDCYNVFFRITQYNIDVHNMHAGSPLRTHEHLRRTEPADLKIHEVIHIYLRQLAILTLQQSSEQIKGGVWQGFFNLFFSHSIIIFRKKFVPRKKDDSLGFKL